MRERLTAAFAIISLVTLVGAGFVRSYVVSGEFRGRESEFVASQTRSIGQVVAREVAQGRPVDREFLDQLVVPELQLVFERRGGNDLVLSGEDVAGTDDDGAVSSTVFTAGGALTVSRNRIEPPASVWRGDTASALGLLAVLTIIAGAIGYVVARSLSKPFRQLALAAGALGRGRFDLDLPTTRVPEARAISQALESSAAQLRERLEREREFGLLASHVLRTPLTSLRLNLDELAGDPTLPDEARAVASRCLATVVKIGEVAGELVEVSGRGVLLAGAAIPLHDLATQVSQRWSEELEGERRELTAAVVGDIELLFTPGPLEQVLDLVLEEVVRRHSGGVRLVFEGQATTLAIDIICQDAEGRLVPPPEPLPDRTTAVLAALGGLIEAPADGSTLRVLLPRR